MPAQGVRAQSGHVAGPDARPDRRLTAIRRRPGPGIGLPGSGVVCRQTVHIPSHDDHLGSSEGEEPAADGGTRPGPDWLTGRTHARGHPTYQAKPPLTGTTATQPTSDTSAGETEYGCNRTNTTHKPESNPKTSPNHQLTKHSDSEYGCSAGLQSTFRPCRQARSGRLLLCCRPQARRHLRPRPSGRPPEGAGNQWLGHRSWSSPWRSGRCG